MKSTFLTTALFIGLLFTSCAPKNSGEQTTEPSAAPTIIATTSLVADLVSHISPKGIQVKGLMGAGTDPHLYKPTFSDYEAIESSNYLILSGLHLEGKMAEVMMGLQSSKNVYELSSPFQVDDKIKSNDFADGYDPHYWMDVRLWKKAAKHCSLELKKWFPEQADSIEWYTQNYLDELQQLHSAIEDWTAGIPEEKRVIITSHDALNYYARAYRYEVRSLQGFSTAAEFGLKDVKDLVDYIIEEEIPAVFVENIVSDQALNAVVEGCKERGWQVKIGGSLYTDALGEKGSGADTYIGMLRHNAQTMKAALSGDE